MTTDQTAQQETKKTNPFVNFFRRYLFDDDNDSGQDGVNYTRLLLVILFGWMVFWTALPCISLANDFVDVLENIVWGRHFQFGFDKNPYAGAFFGVGVWRLSGKAFFSSFLASQVCVFIGVFSVYQVAKRILKPRTAFLATITLLLINFYGIKATELCDDIMEHAVWPLTMLFVYLGVRGEEKNRWAYWLCAGFFAGLSLMVKYFAPAMYLCVGIPLLFTKEGRAMFRRPELYLALIPFILVILPNVYWLSSFGSKPFEYAAGRAGLGEENVVKLADHFTRPLKALDRAAGVFGVAVIFFALFFPWRRKREERPQYSAFDRVFVWSCCWGSLASALLFSLVTGGKINYSWLVPCFPFMGVWLFMAWSPRITRVKARAYLTAVLLMGFVFGVIFVIRSLETQGYRKDGCDYENYPGHAVAEKAVELWRTVSDEPLPYVVADRSGACSSVVYSRQKPAPEAFFCADVRQSQWVDPEDFFKRGGVMIWDDRDVRHGVAVEPEKFFRHEASASMNKKLNKLPVRVPLTPIPEAHLGIFGFLQKCMIPATKPIPEERFGKTQKYTFDRAVPAWYRKLRGKPKPVTIYMCPILPEGTVRSDLPSESAEAAETAPTLSAVPEETEAPSGASSQD